MRPRPEMRMLASPKMRSQLMFSASTRTAVPFTLASNSAGCGEGLHHSVVNELLRLTLLAPDIVELLMAGRQPRRMSLIWFQRNPLPVDWAAQREIVRRFEEAA